MRILDARDVEPVLHYLDDFILVEGEVSEATHKKEELVSTFACFGVPLELEGPSSCLTFLGIEVDTQALQLRLPEEKLSRLKALMNTHGGGKKVTDRAPEYGGLLPK